MKSLLASILLTVGFTEAVNAQAYSCYRPSQPRIPSGYAASAREMERINEEVERYFLDMEQYAECVSKEGLHAIREAEDVARAFTRAVDEFKRR